MNDITRLFGIQYPIIQAGMVWCSGWKLAAAVSNAGGLGIIGAGSMSPDILRHHIQKCKAATSLPFAVNLPLLYSKVEEVIGIIEEEKSALFLPLQAIRRYGRADSNLRGLSLFT